VHDYGTDEALQIDFIVMEMLFGEDLSSRLRRAGQLSAEEAIRIARQSALGLAAGHRVGLVHRDVKPANLFLSSDVGVKVLDFGIAQLLSDDEPRLTRGVTPHTPHYASPEQLLDTALLTPASDVFSLGLTVLESLAGQYPEGVNAGIRDPLEIIAAGTGAFGTHVPRSLLDALSWSLVCDPQQRLPDGDAFLAALDARHRASGTNRRGAGFAAADSETGADDDSGTGGDDPGTVGPKSSAAEEYGADPIAAPPSSKRRHVRDIGRSASWRSASPSPNAGAMQVPSTGVGSPSGRSGPRPRSELRNVGQLLVALLLVLASVHMVLAPRGGLWLLFEPRFMQPPTTPASERKVAGIDQWRRATDSNPRLRRRSATGVHTRWVGRDRDTARITAWDLNGEVRKIQFSLRLHSERAYYYRDGRLVLGTLTLRNGRDETFYFDDASVIQWMVNGRRRTSSRAGEGYDATSYRELADILHDQVKDGHIEHEDEWRLTTRSLGVATDR
jgi:serine/threonine protein kinase